MRIQSVRALSIDCGFQKQKLQSSRVASPMERWSAYSERRSSWMWPTQKVFVRIEAHDGQVGWSCTNGGEVVALIINAHLSRFVADRTIDDIAEVWDQTFNSLLPNDRSGFAMMAVSGVDIALWDLKAKMSGCPLVNLLGASAAQRLPVYATTDQPESFEGHWWGLKAAMPYGPSSGGDGQKANRALMERFRSAAGRDRRIMLDAFMAWDADYTIEFARSCKDLDIFWVEDPLPSYDLSGLRKIKHELGDDIRLALGNFCFTRWDCQQLIEEGLVDLLQPDVAWAGGVTECLRILELARQSNIPVILHNTSEQPWALAMAAARQTDAVVEFVDRGEGSPLYSLMSAPVLPTAGQVIVPSDPGGNLPPAHIIKIFEADGPILVQNQDQGG
jgi:L-rhamnonate dehydratase